ncbi:hypothetical protein BYT27DRAFT_7260545 [Phlegmacium glaucopus]|nr:hypothetical protein BYT27DRAFT_7260545 [Phlegmacium glaucopus]
MANNSWSYKRNEDKVDPTTGGTFTIKSSKSITFDYTCCEFILVLDGELCLEDKAKLGQIKNLNAGDVMHIDKGTVVKCGSPSEGKGFFVPQLDDEDEDQETRCTNIISLAPVSTPIVVSIGVLVAEASMAASRDM